MVKDSHDAPDCLSAMNLRLRSEVLRTWVWSWHWSWPVLITPERTIGDQFAAM